MLCIYAITIFRGFSYILYGQAFHLVDGAWGKKTCNDDKKSTRRQTDELQMAAVFWAPQVYVCKLRLRWYAKATQQVAEPPGNWPCYFIPSLNSLKRFSFSFPNCCRALEKQTLSTIGYHSKCIHTALQPPQNTSSQLSACWMKHVAFQALDRASTVTLGLRMFLGKIWAEYPHFHSLETEHNPVLPLYSAALRSLQYFNFKRSSVQIRSHWQK